MGNLEVLCGIITLLLLLYYYLTATFNFWKKHNIPGPEPGLFFGTMKDVILGKTRLDIYIKQLYDTYGDTPLIGIFEKRQPKLIIKDPEFIKDILLRDSKLFPDRDFQSFENVELINKFFFFMNGTVVRHLRAKLSPAFTPSKLKDMFHTMLKSSERLDNYLEGLLLNDENVNCSDLVLRLITEMAGNTVMGIDLKTLTRETNENKFFKIIIDFSENHITYWNILRKMIKNTLPQLYDLIGYYVFNAEKTRFFTNFYLDIMKYRKTHDIAKFSIMNLILELKENPGKMAETTDITDEFLVAQAFGMFFVAYETSTIALNNVLYELALNQNIQNKLRMEIRDEYEKNNKTLRYESINAMPYLNAVFQETLRKYPQGPITRNSLTSYTFKDTGITIPKHQHVIIPVYAIHHDPKIYPKPEIYDPERFTDEAIKSRHPMHFIPFGYGLRNCIGERLGVLQTKLGLISILQNYKLDICEKTITSYNYNPYTTVSKLSYDIILKITKIN